jgi:hypothetical protein
MDLASYLANPGSIGELTLADWDKLIPEARQAGMLPRIAEFLQRTARLERVPEQPRLQLRSAVILAEKHRRDVLYELDKLSETLRGTIDRIILLKGAAYVAADLPPARGRVFSDIDILVPRDQLQAVEDVLNRAGWRHGQITAYDQQYYRRWMHQIPPLAHFARQAALDVHHTIVPPTARIALPSEQLFKDLVDLPQRHGFATLSPPDMVLHSAVHLFNEGEFRRGLRDLSDLDLLLRHFGNAVPDFWPALLDRAEKLDLCRPLFYALRYGQLLLGTPVPAEVARWMTQRSPATARLRCMDALFELALRHRRTRARGLRTRTALWLLYVRSHYLKMPLHLLLPHLARKAVSPAQQYASREAI